MATAPADTVTPYDRIGGREVLGRIANRFYDVMEADPEFARLRAMHAPALAPMRASLAGFLTGWLGGPREWFEANPGKCMGSMHAPFAIDRDVADQWARAMERAIRDVAPEDAEMAEAVRDLLCRVARNMARS